MASFRESLPENCPEIPFSVSSSSPPILSPEHVFSPPEGIAPNVLASPPLLSSPPLLYSAPGCSHQPAHDSERTGQGDSSSAINLLPPSRQISPPVSISEEPMEIVSIDPEAPVAGVHAECPIVPLTAAEARRQRATEQARIRRANMTQEQREARNRAERERRRENRLWLNDNAARANAVVRERTRRAAESDEQRAARLNVESNRRAANRQRVNSDLNEAAFRYDAQYDYASHPAICIGDLGDRVCTRCGAKLYRGETAGLCCASGKVVLPPIEEIPDPMLADLFAGRSAQSKSFLENIRRYNSCFQMTSFGCNRSILPGFMPTFRVQGQVYHRIGSLLPVANAPHQFLQIYFMGDNDIQVNERCRLFENVSPNIVRLFQQFLMAHNHLIQSFVAAFERMPSDESRIVVRADMAPQNEHQGRYNAPVHDEVAVVMVQGDDHQHRDIVLQRRCSQLQRIDETHRFYDALQYPLIFWRGQQGWHFNLRQVDPATGAHTSTRLSPMKYYSYRLMVRDDRQNSLFKCGQLLNQFVVDMWAKIESQRLRWFRTNQESLRVDLYNNLRDALGRAEDPAQIGQRYILPSTFIGGPRHMHEYSQDAMAYVRMHGRPDLFITFTCNSDWDEIKKAMFGDQADRDQTRGQRSFSRHDIIARVFRQKVIKMIHVISQLKLFGAVQCHMHSIEWQKRGLPHAHILIWLKDKIRSDRIDQIISAEIPDPVADPILFNIVTRSMIHGPCGARNPDSPCMQNRKCTKRYPRTMISETRTEGDGYPLYRRRSPQHGGQTFFKNNSPMPIDNSWVVPYNPVLSKMFNAHINVEFCHSVKSIKYICKYVNKGSDMAIAELASRNETDEIKQYQLGRYISSNEAFWKIFSFPIHERYPPVEHLSVHLEDAQRIYFNPENAAQRAERPAGTTLTEFFKLCNRVPFARSLLYTEVPQYFRWTNKVWQERRQGNAVEGFQGRRADNIGRMYTVHPSSGELFYLRILLTKIRGPTSFQHLRSVDGFVCETFKEACQLLGYLELDTHWETALREAAHTCMPPQMRALFALIMCECFPAAPDRLWELFKKPLSEDILHRRRLLASRYDIDFDDHIFNDCLISIEDYCIAMSGKSNVQVGLPAPNRQALDTDNSEILRETTYDRQNLCAMIDANLPQLVPDQKIAFDTIVDAIDKQEGGLYFLDAPGGTGKTFLINLILAKVRMEGHVILAVAASGIAATLLEGGRTAHSSFRLPIDLTLQTCSIRMNSPKGRMLQICRAVIWDECTMSNRKSLDALNNTLQFLRANDSPLGGIVFVFAGDFRQTLPVIKGGTGLDQLDACLKQWPYWRNIHRLSLTTNMRVLLRNDSGSEIFAQQLLSIGEGRIPINCRGNISFPSSFCNQVASREELIDRVFPDLATNLLNTDWLCERALLAPKNDIVDELNESVQSRLTNTPCRTYFSVDTTIDPDQAVHCPTEFLNSLSPPGMPAHQISLKIGSPIMVLRNLNPPKLCNGTRLSVRNLHNNLIEATIMMGTYKGEVVFIPRIPLIPSDCVVEFKRLQFPIRLAFAVTINKSQGQSLKVAGLDLSEDCFSHGQLYVACSRVGSPSNLFALTRGGEVKNVVYPDALR